MLSQFSTGADQQRARRVYCVEHTADDPFWEHINAAYARQIDLKLFDTIEINRDELEALIDFSDQQTINDTFTQPALPEFRLIIRSGDGVESLSYTKSILHSLHFRHQNKRTARINPITYQPILDIHYSAQVSGRTDNIVCAIVNRDDQVTRFSMFPCWARQPLPNGDLFDASKDELFSKFTAIYVAIQKLLYQRPELIAQATTQTVFASPINNQKTQKKKRKKPPKALLVKKIWLQPENLVPTTTKKRTISCPSWGVIGHYRTYKSGKQVWIAPYRKGKHRQQSEAYVAKEYQLVTTDNAN